MGQFVPFGDKFKDPRARQECLARYLHSKQCTAKHTDRCSWDYEEYYHVSWKKELWDCDAHKEYLDSAKYLLTLADFVTVMNILYEVIK